MSNTALSLQAKAFLDENIQSVEALDVLFLLRTNEAREWDAVDVSKHLGIEPITASNHLMALHLQGLLGHQKAGGPLFHYRYRPYPKTKEKLLNELAATFETARVEVTDYLFSRQQRQFTAFADAFKLGNKDK